MSPIPSVATPFALSPAAPSVSLDPHSSGQSTSMTSQHLLGTTGLLFAVATIMSVVGYFCHGRASANGVRTNNTWASLTTFFSSIRHRGSAITSTSTATNWSVDVEVGLEVGLDSRACCLSEVTCSQHHVSMVYAKFFHPTFWNLVECHPGTSSAPTIYVEDEASEIPVSEPKPPGMNSFLDMDDNGNLDRDNGINRAREKHDRGGWPRVEVFPPYDTSSPINVNFTSEIIGTTIRPGVFLSIPAHSSEGSLSDFVSVPDEPDDDSSETSSPNSDFDFCCSAYDGISTSPPRSSSSGRRYGVADTACISQSLKDTISEEGYDWVPTISCRTGLVDIHKFSEVDPTISCGPLERVEREDDPTASDCDISVRYSRDDLQDAGSWSNADTPAASHDGMNIMRRIISELRDLTLDCSPRALSESTESEYDDDSSIPSLAPAWRFDNISRNSLESTSSTPTTDSDVSDGPIYPLTPPAKSSSFMASVPYVDKVCMSPPALSWFKEEVQVMSLASLDSLVSLPSKVYVCTYRNSRSVVYGPRLPVAALPPL